MLEEGEVDWWWWLGRSWTSSEALRLFRAQRASPSLWPYRGCIGDFSPVERELVFWYAICMESLSPEFEAPNLKNGRDLPVWLRAYSLMKISGVSRFLGALPPQPLRKFRGRTHTWTGWSYLDSRGFEWVQGGLGSVPRRFGSEMYVGWVRTSIRWLTGREIRMTEERSSLGGGASVEPLWRDPIGLGRQPKWSDTSPWVYSALWRW